MRRANIAGLSAALAVLCITTFTVGCASGPATKREKGAATGAAVGAAAGAVIGNQTGDQGEGAVIGGVLGAIAGGAIGDQAQAAEDRQDALEARVEAQERELERNRELLAELRARNLNASQTDRGVVVTLPDVLFEFGSSDLTQSAKRTVRDIADILVDTARGRKVSVEGHTDSIGAELYNQGLSERRAATVATHLAVNGVHDGLLDARGYGEKYPVAPNTTDQGADNPSGRARNRRVEVVILN